MYRRLGGPSNLKGSARWNWVARHFILQQPEFNTPPRKRGRPRGSINPLKDDLKILDEVYDLALGARLTFDQALRQVIRQHEGKGTLSRDAERTTAPKRIRRLAKNIALQSALQNRQNYGVAVLPPFEELFGDKKREMRNVGKYPTVQRVKVTERHYHIRIYRPPNFDLIGNSPAYHG